MTQGAEKKYFIHMKPVAIELAFKAIEVHATTKVERVRATGSDNDRQARIALAIRGRRMICDLTLDVVPVEVA
jgi:hypothetical protein